MWGGTYKLYVAGCLLGFGGRSRLIFPKNVGALKVAILLVDLFTDWAFFGLSCVTSLGAERDPHTMLIRVFAGFSVSTGVWRGPSGLQGGVEGGGWGRIGDPHPLGHEEGDRTGTLQKRRPEKGP